MPRKSSTTKTVTPARPPSSAYPKGSPQRTVVKKSYQTPTIMGFTRSGTTTSVNGQIVGSTTTTSSGGGGGGGILGLVLIGGGIFMLWVVFKGRSGAMWDAITGNSGFDAKLDSFANAISPTPSSPGGSGGSPGKSTSASANAADSGTHMGIDSSGNIITINSSYGDMTPDQKDAANAFAHQIGNVG